MTNVLRIDPDGEVTELEHPTARDAAYEYFGSNCCEVLLLTSPLVPKKQILIGWVDEWGAVKPLPLNRKAWALYGRSPVFGTMILGADSNRPLNPALVAMLTGEKEWIPVGMSNAMDRIMKGQPQ